MNIGYLYGFNSYTRQNGGCIHVYNLIEGLIKLGCRVHTFDHEQNPQCVTYSVSDEGTRDFLHNIDILYIRIDGWYLSRSELKLKCMEQATSKPIVWEINATPEERLKIERMTPTMKSTQRLFEKLKKKIQTVKLQSTIRREERQRREYAKRVEAAICVSRQLIDYAVNKLGISKSIVISNGSDPSLFFPEKKNGDLFKNYSETFKVIYIGDSRWPWQGFDLVKGLAALARREEHQILFVVLDNSPLASHTKEDNLLVIPRVDYFDVPAYVATADACLCLYHDATWSRYGFHLSPLKLFDYMASGKPVIASRLGQIATVIEDGKDGLLTTNDLNDIYAKILFCLEHKDKADQMGRSAREKVIHTYNWEKTARSTLDFFNTVKQSYLPTPASPLKGECSQ